MPDNMDGGNDGDCSTNSGVWQEKTLSDFQAEQDRFVRELRNGEDGASSGPFSAFKNFIDTNFNTLAERFREFPGNLAELRARMQREQERQQDEELDISRRWTGSTDSPDHIQMELSRSTEEERKEAQSATELLLAEAFERNVDVPPTKIQALFQDNESMLGELDRLVNPMLALGGAWYYLPETGDRIPVGKDKWRWLAPSPRWLSVDWFKRSPYSPIRLEAHPDLGIQGAKWRAAFEDLMNASLGKPMESQECVGIRTPHGKPQSTYDGPGLEWMLSLQCRGILPPLLPRFYNEYNAQRPLSHPSFVDELAQGVTKFTSNECSLAWSHPAIARDLSDLMLEVATKATSSTEAEPKPVQLGKIMPDTEQDLYESSHIYLPGTPNKTSLSRPWDRNFTQASQEAVSEALAFSRDKDDDWQKADCALWEALHRKDAKSAAQILNEWYGIYKDVGDLIHEPLDEFMRRHAFEAHSEWYSILNEAIRCSDLPDDDFWKQTAFSNETQLLEQLDKAPLKEKWRRRQLMKRGDEIAGYTLTWPLCSTEKLEEVVERMEQEHENMDELSGEKKAPESMPKSTPKSTAASQKPDVLSALTTTQTTRLADGTVTTKVVLKKRFTDGTEETTESVHTTNEHLEQQQQRADEKESEKKARGWFWS